MKETILLFIFLPLLFCSCSNEDELKKDYRTHTYFDGVVNGQHFLVGNNLTPSTSFRLMGYSHRSDRPTAQKLKFTIPLTFKNGDVISLDFCLNQITEGTYMVAESHPLGSERHNSFLFAVKNDNQGIYLPHAELPVKVTLDRVISETFFPILTGTIEGVLYNEDSSDSIVIGKSTFHIQGDKQ